ncbi:MmgE/PrpD family protein [Aeromicrobium sp. S22]|uniref:MmgE/PrpD family protein n=1 Tax=Aeromicrobium sp. S22 TaxID=2662029 RepID=UPI00129EA682|nr:MmgE/PrpD family protein [Aeromicrobium sp. S22]MRK00152.1 MmgE/PrpD family protein [Aeromicrobium sp. S22]
MTGVPADWTAWRERLAARIEGVTPGSLLADDALRRKAALVLMDDLAAMHVGASHAEVIALAQSFASPIAPGESMTALGSRGPRDKVAAVNAAAAGWDELDEGYRPATCHGGLYTVPAVIAEAEATGRTLEEVLAAVVVGYEVVTAFARAFPAPRPLVLHPHATLSPIGAAAAVTWLRTGSAARVMQAVDVAATLSMSGPFSHAVSGALVRNAWAGAGAVLGFLASDLASAGLGGEPTGPVDVFAAGYGQAADDLELAGPHGSWAILDGYHKVYAACQYTHSALEAALELAQGPLEGRSVDEIAEVVVSTHPLAYSLDNRQPTTTLAGKFSLPHVVAAVLVTGRTDPATFGEELLDDPAVASLRQRVRLAPFEPLPAAPHDRPARLTVTLTDESATSLEAQVLSAVGGPDRPLEEDQVLDKITQLTSAAPRLASVAHRVVATRELDGEPWSVVLAEAWQR